MTQCGCLLFDGVWTGMREPSGPVILVGSLHIDRLLQPNRTCTGGPAARISDRRTLSRNGAW